MTTLDDFFGDGSAENTPECCFCGGTEGDLIVSVEDAYGPTHWHHVACLAADEAKKGTPITPTWDEAMDAAEQPERSHLCMKEDSICPDKWQPLFSEGFM